MSDGTSGRRGIGFTGALFLLLLGLKLTGHIDSWWWVFAPLLIPLGLIAAIGAFAAFCVAFGGPKGGR